MPPTVRSDLIHRIDAHLRTQRNRNYDDLRVVPEFAPYIGKELGPRGEKRLDRLIKKVRATAPSLRDPSETTSNAKSEQGPSAVQAAATVPTSPAQVLSGRATAILGHHELVQLHEEALPDIDRALRDLRNAQGELTDGDLYVKLRRERRETVNAIGKLQDSFVGGLSKSSLVHKLIERVLAEAPDDPERRRTFSTDVNNIFLEFAGLPATTKEL